ncbi:MAG: hypothetical protein IPK03_06775 [Bacteroidetes bacterium]|nr:hypothetical protein [Bacteroidota bacterium]
MNHSNQFRKNSLSHFRTLIILFLFLVNNTIGFSQCNPFSGANSGKEPCIIEYDNMVSSFHQSIVRPSTGNIRIWGGFISNTATSVLSPQDLTVANYPALTGTILKFGLGSKSTQPQMIVLTTTGLFAGSTEGIVLNAAITTSTTFQKLTINGQANGLPAGVAPTDVKMMSVTGGAIAITTNAGRVFTIVSTETIWRPIIISAGDTLSNICVCRASSSLTNTSFFALRNR